MKEVVLREYLVTVYDVVSLARKGAYTLYGESYNEVREKVLSRSNDGEMFTLDYRGSTEFTSDMLV